MVEHFLKSLSTAFAWFVVVVLSICISGIGFFMWTSTVTVSDGVCNIAVVPIHGQILGYSSYMTDDFGNELYDSGSPEAVQNSLTAIKNDENIRGVLFKIDSPGGSPAGSEAITKMLQKTTLPVVALTGDYAASGGYMIATGADTIISSPFSDIGSIGVTMSYLEYSKQNETDGATYVPLTSAPFKDSLSSEKPITDEERALAERDLKMYHDAFVQIVAANRNIPVEMVATLADGSSMPAQLAFEYNLIDNIGDIDTARTWFAENLGMPVEEVIVCE